MNGRVTVAVAVATLALSVAASSLQAQPILRWTGDGEAAIDYYGKAVAGAGDMNGDGHKDIIVGAFQYSGIAVSAGRAYVYFGSPIVATVPDLILDGEHTYDWFGEAVAGAGDVNGDGYDDVIVGARGNDAGGSSAGRAYVYFGGPAPDAIPDLVLTGESYGDLFGWAVAGAGDVNHDGFDDVLVSAPNNDAGGTDAGRVYLFLGGHSPDAVPDLVLTGAAPTDHFGAAIAGAGDVNDDGFADVIVGAVDNDTGGLNAGRAYLFFGGAAPDGVPDLVLTGYGAADAFGYAVAGAGDPNNDGFADLLVGAPGADVPTGGGHFREDAGRAYLYYGGNVPDAVPDLILNGEAPGSLLGSAVAGLLHFDGDGFDDIAVGAPQYGSTVARAGRAYVYAGGPGMDAIPESVFDGVAPGDLFGAAIAGPGDVVGTGYGDLLIGARGFDGTGVNAGRAYLWATYVPNRPPDCSTAMMSRDLLKSKKHMLVPVQVEGVTDPDGDPVTIEVTSITMDEPPTGPGDNTCPDAYIDGGPNVRVRVEHTKSSKGGNGRIYMIHFTASDPSGATCEGAASVCVPAHDSECVDDGQIYNATAICPGLHTDDPLVDSFELRPASVTGSQAVVNFSIAEEADVRLELFDIGGRRLRTIEQSRFPAGAHRIVWNPVGLTPGVYFYRLTSGDQVLSKPVMVLH